jgi:hypothetical protein
MKKNEKCRECSMCEERRGVMGVLVGKPEGNYHWEDPGLDGRVIFMNLQAVGCEGMD